MTRPGSNRSIASPITGSLCLLAGVILGASGMMCTTSPLDFSNLSPNVATLLRPAPGLPIGGYDYFGALKSPAEAREMVIAAGLDPQQPGHSARIGLVLITPELIAEGRDLFFKQQIGDPFTLNNILGLLGNFNRRVLELALDSFDPSKDPSGALAFIRDVFFTSFTRGGGAVTNLRVRLTNDLHIGSRIISAGTTMIPRNVSAANSLHALLDRDLRAILVANNRANAQLARANIEGGGHEFFVDPAAGFTHAQQADLIAFLLALDDDPGRL